MPNTSTGYCLSVSEKLKEHADTRLCIAAVSGTKSSPSGRTILM